jgi:5-methyltetrahydrofolate--homocysteine methyltransferase
VAADDMTPYLVSKLRRYVKGPLICKPNAGNPVIGADGIPSYDMPPADFVRVQKQCFENGATLLGGCCGTTPEHIRAITTL